MEEVLEEPLMLVRRKIALQNVEARRYHPARCFVPHFPPVPNGARQSPSTMTASPSAEFASASFEIDLPNEAATEAAGRALAAGIAPGLTIFLSGPLGAGKTSLTRALLRALGVTGQVKSPTYALVELYAVSSLNLYHFDFYRFNDPGEWIDAGFRDHFGGSNVCLVEWPEKASGLLPPADLWIRLALKGDGRKLSLSALTDAGRKCLTAWQSAHTRNSPPYTG